ncbi:MAG: hypothetical protein RL341_2102 [Pseudomonadota bacterium]|jgi:hypothetical protein
MATHKASAAAVSANNPCPFLRALVATEMLADDGEPLGTVAKTIVATAKAGEGHPNLPYAAIYAIALIANGLSPLQIAKNRSSGLRLNALRGGPLDKQGAGSGIINKTGSINKREFERLKEFASKKQDAAGTSELGLDEQEITRFMDANFKRAEGRRRLVDRALMNGEWPVLLKVMGKDGAVGRYLSIAELHDLFFALRLPARMVDALAQ